MAHTWLERSATEKEEKPESPVSRSPVSAQSRAVFLYFVRHEERFDPAGEAVEACFLLGWPELSIKARAWSGFQLPLGLNPPAELVESAAQLAGRF